MTKIRTTHVGSLPRTAQLLEANDQRSAGTISDEKFNEILTDAVDQVIKRQHQIGLDVINERRIRAHHPFRCRLRLLVGLLLHPLLWPRDHRPLLAQERRGLGPQQARAQRTRQNPPDQLR